MLGLIFRKDGFGVFYQEKLGDWFILMRRFKGIGGKCPVHTVRTLGTNKMGCEFIQRLRIILIKYFHLVRISILIISLFGVASCSIVSDIENKIEYRKRYAELTQDCVGTINVFSWQRAMWPVEREAYNHCLALFKADKEELEFNLSVLRELRESSLWYDSATWLHQNGLYVPEAIEICERLGIQTGTPLYSPNTVYPPYARHLRREGRVYIEATFYAAGFLKELLDSKGDPKYDFEIFAKRHMAKVVFCPSEQDQKLEFWVRFKLES